MISFMNLRLITIVSTFDILARSISSSYSGFIPSPNPRSPYESLIFSAVSMDIRSPSARSDVTCSPPIGITPAYMRAPSSYTARLVALDQISTTTTPSSFCLRESVDSPIAIIFGYTSAISTPTSRTHFLIFARTFVHIDTI